MDCAQLWTVLLLLLAQLCTHTRSDPAVVVRCRESNLLLPRRVLTKGESVWFVPKQFDPANNFTWYYNSSQGGPSNHVTKVSTEETEPVHAKGPELLLLNLTQSHTGCYMAQETGSLFRTHYLLVQLVPDNSTLHHHGPVSSSGEKAFVRCPDPVKNMCERVNGSLSWEKDSAPLPDRHSAVEIIQEPGLYGCVCSWMYRDHIYRSVGIRPVTIKDTIIPLNPVKILSPFNGTKQLPAAEGERLQLNCTVHCGINVRVTTCKAWWETSNSERYNSIKVLPPPGSNETIVTDVLTIERVSAQDFNQPFKCSGTGPYGKAVSVSLSLTRKESMASLVAVVTSVFLLAVIMAVMVKCFSVDLALFFRRFIPLRMKDDGLKTFDAYVVYQLESKDKPTEDALTRFVSQDLPFVLEEQCGYRLFIHGRDDLPGEDQVELVEERMRKSRRLIVVLTAASGSEVCETYERPDGYDWQVGLHQALVQRDLSVILIQLGDTDTEGFKHLPPALQHLIQRSAPLRWPMEPRAARVNSRFWKRVRYLMPAAPIQRYHISDI